jgi:phage shock protein PspC (stress-responsive transcriptional regulator)
MKKVININFQGRIIPIEESAHDILRRYIESLTNFFANEEGKEEIINDIEGRIAELFGETLKKGTTCITEDDVNTIINSMGRPEDFESEEASVQSQLGGEKKQQQSDYTSSAQQQYSSANTEGTKRLYRDENHKVLGGVCSGVANYFGIDPVIVRVLFLIFFGVTFIPYLILWIAIPSNASVVIGSRRRRLFRDPDEKIISGVCGGIAQYFDINVWIPRVLFLLPFLSIAFRFGHWGLWDFSRFLSISFSPGAIFVYIILWIVIPEAKSSADKLEMKGEKVDLNTIKNTIQGDMEGFSKRAEQWGKEMGQKAENFGKDFSKTATEKGKQFTTEATTVAKKTSRGFGDVIVLIAKIFAYFILGSVVLGIVVTLFGLGIVFTGFLPIKDFLINDGWQSVCVWGTLLFFIWTPVLGIVVWIIRRLTKSKANSTFIRSIFISLWIIGWVSVICLVASVSNDIRTTNRPQEETVSLLNPNVNKLEVKVSTFGNYYRRSWLHFEPFASIDDDTAYVRNIRIRIIKSNNDSFQIKMIKLSDGATKESAQTLASKINFNISQQDTTLLLDKGIAINTTDKFRNQRVVITIAVPVGKRIFIDDHVSWYNNVHIGFNDRYDRWYDHEDNDEFDWQSDVEYIMTKEGKLERTHKKENKNRNSRNDWDDNDNGGSNNATPPAQPADSTKYHYKPEPKKVDSIQKKTAVVGGKMELPFSLANIMTTKLFI